MKLTAYISVYFTFILFITACNDPTTRNIAIEKKFVPDQQYLSHTISVQQEIDTYPYPKTNEGYEVAGTELKNPLTATKENLDRGKVLFEGFCAHCHGLTGNADGLMIRKDKYPPPPPFRVRLNTINEGKMYHSISLGKNYMPAHAADLNPKERWQVITYVIKTFKTKK